MLARWLNAQDGDLRAYVASRSAQMDQRRYQLSLIKDFIDDPTRFGIYGTPAAERMAYVSASDAARMPT